MNISRPQKLLLDYYILRNVAYYVFYKVDIVSMQIELVLRMFYRYRFIHSHRVFPEHLRLLSFISGFLIPVYLFRHKIIVQLSLVSLYFVSQLYSLYEYLFVILYIEEDNTK